MPKSKSRSKSKAQAAPTPKSMAHTLMRLWLSDHDSADDTIETILSEKRDDILYDCACLIEKKHPGRGDDFIDDVLFEAQTFVDASMACEIVCIAALIDAEKEVSPSEFTDSFMRSHHASGEKDVYSWQSQWFPMTALKALPPSALWAFKECLRQGGSLSLEGPNVVDPTGWHVLFGLKTSMFSDESDDTNTPVVDDDLDDKNLPLDIAWMRDVCEEIPGIENAFSPENPSDIIESWNFYLTKMQTFAQVRSDLANELHSFMSNTEEDDGEKIVLIQLRTMGKTGLRAGLIGSSGKMLDEAYFLFRVEGITSEVLDTLKTFLNVEIKVFLPEDAPTPTLLLDSPAGLKLVH